MEERDFIDFGVAYFHRQAIIGLAVVDVPATPASQEYYAICVYVYNNTQPIMIPYTTAEERDSKYAEFKEMM